MEDKAEEEEERKKRRRNKNLKMMMMRRRRRRMVMMMAFLIGHGLYTPSCLSTILLGEGVTIPMNK